MPKKLKKGAMRWQSWASIKCPKCPESNPGRSPTEFQAIMKNTRKFFRKVTARYIREISIKDRAKQMK